MMIQNRPHTYYMGEQQFASYLDHMIERIEDAREIEDSEMCEEKLRRIITDRQTDRDANVYGNRFASAGLSIYSGPGRFGSIRNDRRRFQAVVDGSKRLQAPPDGRGRFSALD